MQIVKHCPACGKKSTLGVPEAGYLAWQQGDLYAREAFPDLTREQIDQLLTGWHPECVEKLEEEPSEFPELMALGAFDLEFLIEG